MIDPGFDYAVSQIKQVFKEASEELWRNTESEEKELNISINVSDG